MEHAAEFVRLVDDAKTRIREITPEAVGGFRSALAADNLQKWVTAGFFPWQRAGRDG